MVPVLKRAGTKKVGHTSSGGSLPVDPSHTAGQSHLAVAVGRSDFNVPARRAAGVNRLVLWETRGLTPPARLGTSLLTGSESGHVERGNLPSNSHQYPCRIDVLTSRGAIRVSSLPCLS